MILTHTQKRNNPLAVVLGVTGQDGSYLSELLLDKGYKVIGVKRRSSVNTSERLKDIPAHKDFTVIEGDITDPSSMMSVMTEYKPEECYNLAAQSHVGTSFKQPVATFQIDAVGVLNILEAIRVASPETKFYQASTSELFGSNYTQSIGEHMTLNKDCVMTPKQQEWVQEFGTKHQNEQTPFAPNSPYSVAKMAAHDLVRVYREAYGLHASCGILFNHESPRRGEEFVTRKITKWIGEFQEWIRQGKKAHTRWQEEKGKFPGCMSDYTTFDLGTVEGRIYCGMDSFPKLRLGNLDAQRDWGHARDYVRGMWMMVQEDSPDDYVLGTGKTYSIKDFLDEAFKYIGIEDWTDYVVIDPKFYRPVEVEYLLGDASKAKEKFGWESEITFTQLVHEMVKSDIDAQKK